MIYVLSVFEAFKVFLYTKQKSKAFKRMMGTATNAVDDKNLDTWILISVWCAH